MTLNDKRRLYKKINHQVVLILSGKLILYYITFQLRFQNGVSSPCSGFHIDLHRNNQCSLRIIQSAGLGGGSIINVMLISGLNYSAKKSITISYIILIGGALAAIITGAKKFTPSGKRCIDYDLVIRTLPMMMSGAIVGVNFT